jgi:hypothetical protein|tara:strand:- start:4454 stop:5434 length:981 start_codon:yes stop_codon:yes gene_type:complete
VKPILWPAILLALGGTWVLFSILIPPEEIETLQIASSRQCLECHADVAKEWEESHHAFAYKNPEVRKLSQDFRNEECLACHAPRPVLLFEPGTRVLARNADRGMGVDCLACHLTESGNVATTNTTPNSKAPCKPKTVPRLAEPESCAACHNQHKTVDQWRATPPKLNGKPFRGENCLHCHMPQAWRSGGRKGSDHSFRASHDLEALQSAVTLSANWEVTLSLTLQNHGAAHNFPTDERSRAADLAIRWSQEDGSHTDWLRQYRFRDPYRDETELQNTTLPGGETWNSEVPIPEGAVSVQVRLLYRTNPFQSDEDAFPVYELELKRP